MRKRPAIYTLFNKLSAICMILALLWLTVSLPVVFKAERELAKTDLSTSAMPNQDEESSNPFSGTTEEKAPSTTSFSEEFLHDHHAHDYFSGNILVHFGCGNAGTYVAYHGELHVPPPNLG